jgi:hypothetical protein
MLTWHPRRCNTKSSCSSNVSRPTSSYPHSDLRSSAETIPTPIPIADALAKREARALAVLAADPSLAPPTALPSFTFSTSIAHVAANREKRLQRAAAAPDADPVPAPAPKTASARAPRRRDEDRAFKAPKEARAAPSAPVSAPAAARPVRATRTISATHAADDDDEDDDAEPSASAQTYAVPARKPAAFTPSLTGGTNAGRTIYSMAQQAAK